MDDQQLLEDLAQRIEKDPSILFVTGAGLSADSGLPTYRGVGGLYDNKGTADGIPIEEALSGPMFRKDPDLTWKYIRQIEEACRGASPNRAHEVMAALEKKLSRVVVLTQNVDGLHRAAGTENLIEIHGTVHDLRCPFCGWTHRVDDYSHLAPGTPECGDCFSVIRPRVVLFGEMLPSDGINKLEAELAKGFDLVFSVGTTSVFPYIAAPVYRANREGGLTVEINPGDTEVSYDVQHRLRRGAADALGRLGELVGV
ncbi:MAG: NAD-dependent deacylase [Deltaproteobacteria bacterium]|nr:NAD-dependent deacylase [Deltaproteobacteria bacterium]